MKNMRTHAFRYLKLCAPIAAMAVSGCLLNPDSLPPNEVVPTHQLYNSMMQLAPSVVDPQVETITLIHKTNFAFGADNLSKSEIDRLTMFLETSGADHTTRIEIDGPRKAAGKHDILTVARMSALSRRLTGQGMRPALATRPVNSMTVPDDSIVVIITRAMVIEPDCAVPKTIYTPRPTHIWTCSNTVALGRMIVEPLDLERGRPQGPANAEALTLGIERYRTGKIKEIKNQSVTGSE